MQTIDEQIAALKPGRQAVLSRSNGFTVFAERSGDGKTIRIVRESRNGFTVIATQAR